MATTLHLLGTNGGPVVRAERWQPAHVITVDGVPYVIDCGDGVARRMVEAGLALRDLATVFITHHHCDHNLGYGPLLMLAWAAGLVTPVRAFGPPPLADITAATLAANRYDIDIRRVDEGRPPLDRLISTSHVDGPGVVYQDDLVRVTAVLVDHPPVEPSLAYRFDTPDTSIVLSGDTAPCDALVELATGAEFLVHEALFTPLLDRELAVVPNAPLLRAHLLASHTPVEQVGPLAERAGVPNLILTHLVPGGADITDDMWLEEATRGFSGTVTVGADLMSFDR